MKSASHPLCRPCLCSDNKSSTAVCLTEAKETTEPAQPRLASERGLAATHTSLSKISRDLPKNESLSFQTDFPWGSLVRTPGKCVLPLNSIALPPVPHRGQ